jgi:hypothetical protein
MIWNENLENRFIFIIIFILCVCLLQCQILFVCCMLYIVMFLLEHICCLIPKIVDTLVSPVLLYACEVIGFDKNDNIEKVHLQFLKKYS